MKKKDDDKRDDSFDFLNDYKNLAYGALALAIGAYALAKTLFEFDINDASHMAAIGDYFGGLLSPTFALIGLFALLATIKLQSKALNISSEELKLTRHELENSTIAQQEQSSSIKEQNFENTFFNMINLHNQNIDNLVLIQIPAEPTKRGEIWPNCYKIKDWKINERIRIHHIFAIDEFYKNGKNGDKPNSIAYNIFDDKDYKSKKVFTRLVEIFKEYLKERNTEYLGVHSRLYSEFYDEYEDLIGHYFRTIYQILKFVKESAKEGKIYNPDRYAHLFRSQFSRSELELLFYHGASYINRNQLLPVLVEFEFFENTSPSDNLDEEFINSYICDENSNAFGKNIDWIMEKLERDNVIKTKSAHEPL
jgi:hypothetical protein